MRKKLGVIILFNIIIISFLSVIYAETKVNDMPTFAVVESVNSSEETKEVVKSVEAKTVSSNADSYGANQHTYTTEANEYCNISCAEKITFEMPLHKQFQFLYLKYLSNSCS